MEQEFLLSDMPPIGYYRATPKVGDGWGDGVVGGDLHGNGVGGVCKEIEEGY